MKNYLTNWNWMRFLRLALGIMAIIQGFQSEEILLIIMGVLFSILPILNVGCGSTSGCSIPQSHNNETSND